MMSFWNKLSKVRTRLGLVYLTGEQHSHNISLRPISSVPCTGRALGHGLCILFLESEVLPSVVHMFFRILKAQRILIRCL